MLSEREQQRRSCDLSHPPEGLRYKAKRSHHESVFFLCLALIPLKVSGRAHPVTAAHSTPCSLACGDLVVRPVPRARVIASS